jgi:hypothetical protein
MEIRIGSSSDYIIIKDILPEGEVFGYDARSIEFLRGTIQLQMNEIYSSIGASFTIYELKQFLTDLQKLYDTLKYSFVFKNLEDNIELAFEPTLNGQIEIKGLLRNSNYTGSIKFRIESDQSYLPDLISSLRELFHEMKIV